MGSDQPTQERQDSMETTQHISNAYTWPDNLYVEMRDLASQVVVVHTLASAMQLSESSGEYAAATSSTGRTPSDIKAMVQNPYNSNPLVANVFQDLYYADPKGMYHFLDELEQQENLTVFYSKEKPYFALCKDSNAKRITLVMRGEVLQKLQQQNKKNSNWLAVNKKLDAPKTEVSIPDSVKSYLKESTNHVKLHSQFYGYLFDPGMQETATSTRYSDMVESLQSLLQDHDDYKVYVAGHGLGAALATIVAFYLSVDASIPKPITCLVFASPRVGDSHFLEAIQALEQTHKLRCLRVVHENDSMTTIPTMNYHHVGFQVTLHEGNHEPLVTYPSCSKTNIFGKMQRAWQNSPLNTWNFEYNSYEYQQAVEKDKMELQQLNLNQLYRDSDLTGFDLQNAAGEYDENNDNVDDLVYSSAGM